MNRLPSISRRVFFSAQFSAAGAAFFFALSAIVVRAVRLDVPPLGLSFWRTLLGFLIVLLIFAGPVRKQAGIIRRHWPILALLSFLLVIGGNALMFVSLHFTSAINVVVLNSTEPILILLVAWMIFRDPVTSRQIFGVAFSLVGVLALISAGSLDTLAQMKLNHGDLLVLLAYLSWSIYAVYLRLVPPELNSRVFMVALLGFGSLFCLPLFMFEHLMIRPTVLDTTTVVTIVSLALTTSILAVFLWNRAVKLIGPGRAGPYMHLIPAFGVVMAILLLGEALHLYHVIGICLIAIGIYFSTILKA